MQFLEKKQKSRNILWSQAALSCTGTWYTSVTLIIGLQSLFSIAVRKKGMALQIPRKQDVTSKKKLSPQNQYRVGPQMKSSVLLLAVKDVAEDVSVSILLDPSQAGLVEISSNCPCWMESSADNQPDDKVASKNYPKNKA